MKDHEITALLDEAEWFGFVTVPDLEGRILTIDYHETPAGAWFYSITHKAEVLFLIADEAVAVKRLRGLVG